MFLPPLISFALHMSEAKSNSFCRTEPQHLSFSSSLFLVRSTLAPLTTFKNVEDVNHFCHLSNQRKTLSHYKNHRLSLIIAHSMPPVKCKCRLKRQTIHCSSPSPSIFPTASSIPLFLSSAISGVLMKFGKLIVGFFSLFDWCLHFIDYQYT